MTEDFIIEEGVLIEYKGKEKQVSVPSGVTEIADNAFDSCYDVQFITLPESVEKIGREAFAYCVNLQAVNLPPKVTCLSDGLFKYCKSLMHMTVHKNIEEVGKDVFYGCEKIVNLDTSATLDADLFDYVRKCTQYTKFFGNIRVLCVCEEGEEGAKGYPLGKYPSKKRVWIAPREINHRELEGILTPQREIFHEDCKGNGSSRQIKYQDVVLKDGAFYGVVVTRNTIGYVISEDNYYPSCSDEFILRPCDGKVVSRYEALTREETGFVFLKEK